jgi:hypothetical protein
MVHGLSPEEILDVWERARTSDPIDRALQLRTAVESTAAPDELRREPIGQRDAALIEGRIATFGSRAECFVECPACESSLEFDLDLARLLPEPSGQDAGGDQDEGDGPFHLVADDRSITYRLPDSIDLAAVAGEGNPSVALLERCVATADGREAAVALDGDLVERLDAEMARLDPLADVQLTLSCLDCGHEWSSRFDIASYLWREVEVGARRLLGEVDILARAYGWSESEILDLGHRRRQSYLEMLGVR